MLKEWLAQLAIKGGKYCEYCELSEALRTRMLGHAGLADMMDNTWHADCPWKSDPYEKFYHFN